MTPEPTANDQKRSQPCGFLGQLEPEIEALAHCVDRAEALMQRIQRTHELRAERLSAETAALRGGLYTEAAALRRELYQVRRLVEAIAFRFPTVILRNVSALD
ncbi:hypothetical protein CJ179_30580 [Rhodococcus sp. ACS1]|uniref:hypothetical protein n=1 Tax=Rhodococcus sp. ACS1 TaxID=2028570 RepID=UPI000BB16221|nr:hypothetical protein [Rhodococcus sp. ACS1]PBC45070.1 hypothetical protein CJ179_30580 [Rhodococcus sp. ACS1]